MKRGRRSKPGAPTRQWLSFIPPELQGPGDLQRSQQLVRFGVGFGMFNMGFFPVLWMSHAIPSALVCIITTSIMTATPMILRLTCSYPIAAHAFIGSTVALFGGIGALLGGLDAPTTPIMAIAPILAVFLIGRAAGFAWSLVVVLVIVAFYAVPALGYAMPRDIDLERLPDLKAAGLTTSVIVGLYFVLQYDSAKNDAMAVVRAANQRMRVMIGHLDATSTALSDSAAEFLGTELPSGDAGRVARTADGLTQQMLSTADTSRRMMGSVGASLRGMIDQYKAISVRIFELHQQSGHIATLVQAIDNISDRVDIMALNISIEAAHAGESGRRFTLLADDMRRLAERVLQETQRIKASINTVESHTQAAIDASFAGQALTDESTAQLESMARAFDELHRLIDRTADASQRITNDTIAQLTTIHDLVSESLG